MWEIFMQRFAQTGPASTDNSVCNYRNMYTYTWFLSLNSNGRCKLQFKYNNVGQVCLDANALKDKIVSTRPLW